jgi:BNR repeat-containing family member
MIQRYSLFLFIFLTACTTAAQKQLNVTLTEVDSGWASNSVNAVVFRKNSLVTYKDTQFIAFYDQQQFVVLGKRRSGEKKWQLKQTVYKGNATDAHNTISIMVDGDGYLHLSWDHHNNPLRYCKSREPGSLDMTTKIPMTGIAESSVSYPEFYKRPGGDLLFLYRDGGSGRGNLVINKYSVASKQWNQLHSNLIDGEGKRNAYWQTCTDTKGTIHLSWVWRESPDVASNHDMCYARSMDGGISWEKSTGEKYQLPVTASSAEYAFHIPQQSELINQTSMSADARGNPYIASYWRDAGSDIPQYHIIYKKGKQWQVQNPGFRKTAFSLGGMGTKRIPISRPQLLVWGSGKRLAAAIIFRDSERDNKISVAVSRNIDHDKWRLYDLTKTSVGSWEPSFDTELWKEKRRLSLFVQHVEQADAEGKADFPPQMVKVLEWNPFFLMN